MAKADETYHQLLKKILSEGLSKADRTKTGTSSIFGHQVRFNMGEGLPLLTTKKIHTKSIIHELLWFLRGDTNVEHLQNNGVTIWNEWADEEGELGPVYGKQWTNWGGWYSEHHGNSNGTRGVHFKGINQIQQCLDLLRSNPDSRRIIVNAWNVGELKDMKLPPCHYGFQLYTRELNFAERAANCPAFHTTCGWKNLELSHKKMDALRTPTREISLMWNQRSIDTFLGLPFNIASYALLLHMFAQQVNMVPGELIGNLGDTHIYNNHYTYVKEQLTRNTNRKAPQLKLKKADNIFSYNYEDFEILNYEADPNWKDVPIAV
jgi:thymidylate synthase|tara:strand:- start:1307 stop:2266 length:960 start_codon:yes stop_codon:yes gene_type:complete